ncbi:MAG: PEGA domain-containing protein [Chloracidobacterium sp.]|uniref:PEGA domain-containing protein n=1 Tax=Chloracidobacterium validum TaxID=2821543 RepID=A0ABX8BA16_9BACT|nr:PEGA domain-containing protein [Chloracidobacterium validum]QUW03511.1 PEGA domain-containing protein [Chloracidobacterium validum]
MRITAALFLIVLFIGAPSASILAQKEASVIIEKKIKTATYRPPSAGTLVVASNTPTGEVLVNSQPSGQLINGKFTKKLNPGRYRLEVRAADYENFTCDITITAGRSEAIIAELKPNFATLSIPNLRLRPTPKPAVFVDGQLLDEARWRLDGQRLEARISPPGTRKIQIRQGARAVYNATLKLEAATAKVEVAEPPKAILRIDSLPTARVYADDVYCGDVSADGSLVIEQLSPDETHRLRIEAERYRTFETDLTLTTEQPTLLRARLEAIIEFADNFTNLYKWDAPPGWAVEQQLLRVGGTNFAVGLPKEVGFRGCEINFDLRIAQGQRAAWVVRGRDERNGYVFILESPTPTTSRIDTYLYRDGVLGIPVQSDPLPLRFEARQWNRIRIVARDNKISHLITPSDSPDEISVALFQDRDKLFPYGAAGFASLADATFYVGGFVVCPEGAVCRPEIK